MTVVTRVTRYNSLVKLSEFTAMDILKYRNEGRAAYLRNVPQWSNPYSLAPKNTRIGSRVLKIRGLTITGAKGAEQIEENNEHHSISGLRLGIY